MKKYILIIGIIIFFSNLSFTQTAIQYNYDQQNQLLIVKQNSVPQAEYIFDKLGNRTSKTVTGQNLEVLPAQLVIASAANSTATLTIKSNQNWTITSSQTWLTANGSSGSGNATITLTATSNTGTEARQATVTVTAAGLTPAVVQVTQAGQQNLLQVSTNTLTLAASGTGSAKFSISSNIAWNIASGETWLSATPGTGSNNAEITVTANSANTGSNSRTATLTISGTGVASQVINVNQSGTIVTPVLALSSSNLSIGSGANSMATFNITSNTNWNFSNLPSWIIANPTNGNGDAQVVFTAINANPNSDHRQATILLNGEGVSQQSVQLIQDGSTGSTVNGVILFAAKPKNSVFYTIWSMNADGSSLKPLFSDNYHRIGFDVSDDGKMLYYIKRKSNIEGLHGDSIWFCKSDTKGNHEQIICEFPYSALPDCAIR